MSALERRQVRALAATLGYLEARIDIAQIQDRAESAGTTRLVYQSLAKAFPELTERGLVDDKYLEGEAVAPEDPDSFHLEPPC